jgi:hypothetical protein
MVPRILVASTRRVVTRGLSSGVVYCLTLASSLASPELPRSLASHYLPPIHHSNPTKATAPSTIRWDEQHPGCTFSRGTDGKYHYGLWAGDIGVVLAVDARELQIIRHRIEPILAAQLTIRYRGPDSLDAGPDAVTLQFVKHFKVIQPALDPDDYIRKVQADADAFDAETRRALAKHPTEKQAREAQLQEYQKSVSEWIEFLAKNAFRTAHLDRANPEAGGWVFFDTQSKWLGRWKSQEEFLLRLPVGAVVFEFPFKLPPEKGEFLLQKRQ